MTVFWTNICVKMASKPDAKQTHQIWLKTLHRTGGIGWLQRKDVDVVGGVSRTLERAAAIDYPLHIIRGPIQLDFLNFLLKITNLEEKKSVV